MIGVVLCCVLAWSPLGTLYGKSGQSEYKVPDGLVFGGAFIDRFLPVPIYKGLETDVWGAENVIPRDAHNGIEDAEYSYWGGNIIQGNDGKEHLFVCRWPEIHEKGHHIWWNSTVVHAVSDRPAGPFKVVDVVGKGHNPEIYQTNDGTYIIGIIGGAYQSKSLNGPWTRFDVRHDARPTQGKLNLTNRTYAEREDGSMLMVTKRGQVWLSKDGVNDFRQITAESVYPSVKGARLEDPVIWKDEVQYHLVVNDWYGRIAFYLRSPDGIRWKWAPGKAYDPTIMRHEGGTREDWYKFERPKVRQDKYGRATHMNFAVIDVAKDDDKGSDNHSSKNVVIPLVVPRRLQILNEEVITLKTWEIRVKILAEEGFDPQEDIDLQSLIFGAPELVNFGKGCLLVDSKPSGSDLILAFAGKGSGITARNFTAKLIGRTSRGGLLFGYSKLPGQPVADAPLADVDREIPYPEAMDDAAVIQPSIDDIDRKAMVIGNGDINALVYSAGNDVRLTVSKNDVWDSRMNTAEDEDLLSVNVKEHNWTGKRGAQPSWNENTYPIQVPSCVIKVKAGKGIRRATLDLRRASAEIESDSGTTRICALWQRNVFLVDSNSEVAIQSCKLGQLPEAKAGSTHGIQWIHQKLPGDGDYKGMSLAAALGGQGRRKVIALVSSHDSETPLKDAIALVEQTFSEDPQALVQSHQEKWAQFWAASGVELEIADFQNWWYRTLYYFRCYSKPGCTAIGLQAGYNRKAGWHGSYKINYNIWQTFWSPFTSNHPELVEPWAEHLYDYLPRARWFAKNAYGCEGAAFHSDTWPHEVDPANCNNKNKNQIVYMPWGYTMGMSGMAIQNLWNYYLYKPDQDYLKARIYPVIMEVAIFYCSFIEKCNRNENGKMIIGPSFNPEHGLFGTDDNPYDLTYTRYTLEAAISAAGILGVDKALVERFERNLTLIPDYHLTPDPKQNNQPVIADWRGAKHNSVGKPYNITVPVIPLFPGEQFSWFSSDADKALYKRTIHHVESNYNRNNSVVILNTARARMSMTDETIKDTHDWFKGQEQSNGLFLWKGHGFYMSEQAAVSALINEFLLQSVDRIIRIFPAWPDDKDASFTDLRAQGGFLVTAEQRSGEVVRLEIISTAGGKLRVLSPWPTIKVNAGSGKRSLQADIGGVFEIDTKAGDRLVFSTD